jgi:acetyl esterase/lipase
VGLRHHAEEANPVQGKKRIKRIYYFAGGSWQSPPTGDHFKLLGTLAQRLKEPTVITLISCPFAPNSPAPETFPKLCNLYATLSKHPAFCEEDVCFAGDSSGGNTALALTMHCLRSDSSPDSHGSKAPGSLLLISPTVDLLHEHPDIREVEEHDPIESLELVRKTGSAWAGDWDKRDPRLSPLQGKVKVLAEHQVKIFGILAGYDVLSPEAKDFVKDCEEAEVEGRFLIWDRQMHIFPLTAHYKIPEAMKAVNWLVEALEEGRRDVEVDADEDAMNEGMLTQVLNGPGRDTDTLEEEASHLRRGRNMKATETSLKAHKEIHVI